MTNRATRGALRLGLRDATPFIVAIVPFAMVYGVAVTESSVDNAVGLAGSWIVLGGAAQLALLDAIDNDATAALAIATAVMINARFALYSAALAPAYAQHPLPWRLLVSYLMTDQGAALSLAHHQRESDQLHRQWYSVAACLSIATTWWAATFVGAGLGAAIPESVDIGFGVPLMFAILAIPTLSERPSLVAGVTGGAIALLASPLPSGSNIVLAGMGGIAAGRVVQVRSRRSATT